MSAGRTSCGTPVRSPRDVLLPIPETEANNLYSLTNKRWQNSGW